METLPYNTLSKVRINSRLDEIILRVRFANLGLPDKHSCLSQCRKGELRLVESYAFCSPMQPRSIRVYVSSHFRCKADDFLKPLNHNLHKHRKERLQL